MFFLIEKNKSVIKVKILRNSEAIVDAEKGRGPSGVTLIFNVSAREVRYCFNT